MTEIGYEVIDLDSDESHGVYSSLDQARGCVAFDRLRAYSIWRGPIVDGEVEGRERVECCDPYDGDDDRARQALGC